MMSSIGRADLRWGRATGVSSFSFLVLSVPSFLTNGCDLTERERERLDRQAEKLARIVGERPPDQWLQNKVQEIAPWYLRPEHMSQSEIVLNPDGGVRAATLPALIERLTMHDGSGASSLFSC